MFKKGQLVKIVETGEFAVISFAHHKECSVYFAKSLTGPISPFYMHKIWNSSATILN